MKKLVIIIVFSMWGICYGQTTRTAVSTNQYAPTVYTQEGADKKIKKSVDSMAALLRAENPVIDTNYFKIVNGRVTLSDKFIKSLFGKADSAALANYKASNDIRVISLEQSRTSLTNRIVQVELLPARVLALENKPPSGVTPDQLKALADKVEAMRLTVPNGLTYPKP